ncbi:hypothetical protein EDC96DRAFT_572194 [Choanephora cucurbitarum]|nr:hypothetical protein EDC96DRAFT_572194 [Choanephora cucurbitarum]
MLENRQSAHYWSNSHTQIGVAHDRPVSAQQNMLEMVPFSELQQGELYIIKIKLVVIALFQGWDDDMCCFSVLRSDLVTDLPIRWSEARYLPNDFDAYPAFDRLGNPPIHLWSKNISSSMPYNWFSMFEEARQWQRQWHASFEEPPIPLENEHHYDENVTTCGSENLSQHHQKPHQETIADETTAEENKETEDSITCGSYASQDAGFLPRHRLSSAGTQEIQSHPQQQLNRSNSSFSSSVSASESLLINRAHVRDYILRPQVEEPTHSKPTPAVQLRKQYKELAEVTQQQLPSFIASSSSQQIVSPSLTLAQAPSTISAQAQAQAVLIQAQAALSSQSCASPSLPPSSSTSPPSAPRSTSLTPVTPLPPLHTETHPSQIKESRSSSSEKIKNTSFISSKPETQHIESKQPETNLKQRRSLSSFFTRKKKNKKPTEEAKKDSKNRKSAPPTPLIAPKQTASLSEVVPLPSLSTSTTMPTLTNVSSVTTPEEKAKKRVSSIKPSKSMASMNSKMELYDMDSLLDMQATFAFLNGDNEHPSLASSSTHLTKAV